MNLLPISIIAFWFGGLLASCGHAQELAAYPPPQLALPTQRLMMEQVHALSEAGQIDEALDILEKLHDEADGRIVPVADLQRAATLATQRFIPLGQWTGLSTVRLLNSFPQSAEEYQISKRAQAAAVFVEQQLAKDIPAIKRAARRYFATDFGSQISLLLSDVYLESGWGVAAFEAAQHASPLTRYPLSEHAHLQAASMAAASLPAGLVWRQFAKNEKASQLQERLRQAFPENEQASAQQRLAEAARRMLIASKMNPQELDADGTQRWALSLTPTLSEQVAGELQASLEQVASWQTLSLERSAVDTFSPLAASGPPLASPTERTTWPAWSQTLEKYSASNDRTTASKPRVAETERGTLPYFPAVKNDLVFLNEMTHIVAYQLNTGKPWPDVRSALPLFDSRISPAAYVPLGYPLVGTPRGTLAIAGDSLYARMGSPITGRANPRASANEQSHSYLVGLDLTKQGSMLSGFPLYLDSSEFPNSEFDGPPMVWGEMLLVPIAARDSVALRRSIVAFDRFSGELVWRSAVLAVGTVSGSERANLISHQMLTLAGGRLYYSTNLGSIACLDPLTGAIEWLVQYSSLVADPEFPQPDRYRYRDLTPSILSAGLLFCAPQDVPEIFALDATTGDLVWSTDDVQVADAVHLLGVRGDSLIVSGDRLVWLDKCSGRVLRRFPAGTTPGVASALPSPRGLGRGAIVGDDVYWPVAGEIFVFAANISGNLKDVDAPAIRQRLRIDTRGSAGGNLLFVDRWMLMSTPSRLMAF